MPPQSLPSKPIPLAMIIDDEAVDQMVFERAVKQSGLVGQMVCFTDAEQALAYLGDPQNQRVDVVFLDVNMPRMTGLEFLAAATCDIGPAFARCCVVMLTTDMTQGARAEAESFPVVRDFVDKPLCVDHLKRAADILVGQSGIEMTQLLQRAGRPVTRL